MFVTFEGIDGSGKTTQVKLLADWFSSQNIPCLLTQEPGWAGLGVEIQKIITNNDLSLSAQLYLFLANRVEHISKMIRPALDDGKIVVCDRYADSTATYQQEAIDEIRMGQNSLFCGLTPCLTIWLDISADQAINRLKERSDNNRFDKKDRDFYLKINSGFEKIYRINPERIIRVDGAGSESEVFQDILVAIKPKLSDWPKN